MKELHDKSVHQFYIRLKEQGVQYEFRDVDLAIKEQIELATNNN